MLITNFITYKCNKCKRTIDISQDNLRVFVNKCVITNHCLGKLAPIAVKKTRNVLSISTDPSLTDWNNGSISNTNSTDIKKSPLSTGDNTITLAVKGTSTTAINIAFAINKSLTTSYQNYNFSLSNFNSIVGKDSSPLKKILKFNSTDVVLVYVNGELYPESSTDPKGYTLSADGSQINFNQTIFAKTNVNVIIYQPSTIEYSEYINFYANEYETANSAWSNVKRISIAGEIYTLFTSTNFGNLPINARLNLYPGSISLPNANLEDYYLLLANPNFTTIDRVLSSALSLSNIFDDNNFIQLSVQNKKYVLQCTSSSIEQVPLITVDRSALKNIANEIVSDTTEIDNTLIINNGVITNIIGII